ncbi:MAG: hypothetical protein WD872_13825 [Pirellulaceae bacterium]
MTLLEVLFAILVTTVGLLGAIALLPVASSQARKGRINDATAVHGPSAFHRFDTEGMRRPDRWMYWDTANSRFQMFGFPFFGQSFCIDPRLIAANGTANGLATNAFPYSPTPALPGPRMQRLTLYSGTNVQVPPPNNFPLPMSKLLADSVFTFDDDLIYTRPDDESLQASAVAGVGWDTLPTGGAISKRQSEGHMSWLATLVPKLDRYTPTDMTSTDQFILSLVVFYDRPADLTVGDAVAERLLHVVTPMAGGGTTGGEVQLRSATADGLKLRPNDWIMLAGATIHPDLNPIMSGLQPGPVNVFKWYRVSSCDPEIDAAGGFYFRYVTLFGQDWDTTLFNPYGNATGTPLTDPNPQQYPQAVVVEGVVGVYEKTIRLEQ